MSSKAIFDISICLAREASFVIYLLLQLILLARVVIKIDV